MPPCNCHPPFPRPEPFSPLPRPGKTPDWGKWIRDRLAEKGALLAYSSSSAFPDPGAGPSIYVALDTGVLYRWDGQHYQVLVDPSAANDVLEYGSRGEFPETGEHGKLYIAADTGSLYRWGSDDYAELLGGKADKAVPATEGNFAALAQDGNLVDSGKKPSDYYTAEQTDEAIDRVAAYYITYTAEGAAFPNRAALLNAQTYYSGGVERTPTRNDYAIVLADESHSGAEWRYIYAVADGQTTGQWEAQYPVEGVITFDNTVTRTSANGVKSSGIWSAIWGALTALPAGFSSLYDWVVNQLAGKQDVLTFDSKPKSGSANPVTSDGILSALTSSTVVNRDMRNMKVAGLPASGTGYFVFRTGDNFDWAKAEWDSARSIWLIGGAGGGFLGLRTTANPEVYEAVHVDLRGTVTHIQDLDFDISDHLSFVYNGVSYTVFGVTDDELAKVSQLPTVPVQSVNGLTGAVVLTGADIPVDATPGAQKIDAALAGKASTADVTLTPVYSDNPTFSDWTVSGQPSGWSVDISWSEIGNSWVCEITDGTESASTSQDSGERSQNAVSVSFVLELGPGHYTIIATRTRTDILGYVLGSQADKPLASEAEAEALRQGKQDALTTQQLANIAAVPNKLDKGSLGVLPLVGYDIGIKGMPGGSPGDWGIGGYGVWYGQLPDYTPSTDLDADNVQTGRGVIGWNKIVSASKLAAAIAPLANRAANPTTGNLAALDAQGNPTDSGVKASDKLDASSASAPFSDDSSVSYPVGSHCTYNGKLYVCTTATTGGTWVAGSWTAEDMTTPDATLDVTATDKLLRLVSTNGDIIWGQGYNLSTESSATVLTEQVSAFTFAADAAADQAIVLPSVAAGKVGDFILDVTNLSANDRSLTLTGLDSAFSVVVKAGDDLSETLTVAAGEMARYYFTMTAFRVNSLPTWQVAKEAVENGGAQS